MLAPVLVVSCEDTLITVHKQASLGKGCLGRAASTFPAPAEVSGSGAAKVRPTEVGKHRASARRRTGVGGRPGRTSSPPASGPAQSRPQGASAAARPGEEGPGRAAALSNGRRRALGGPDTGADSRPVTGRGVGGGGCPGLSRQL